MYFLLWIVLAFRVCKCLFPWIVGLLVIMWIFGRLSPAFPTGIALVAFPIAVWILAMNIKTELSDDSGRKRPRTRRRNNRRDLWR
jgi:hypothetical protein